MPVKDTQSPEHRHDLGMHESTEYQQYLETLSQPLPQYAAPSPAPDPWQSDVSDQSVSHRVFLKRPFIRLFHRIFPGIWPQPSTFKQTQSRVNRQNNASGHPLSAAAYPSMPPSSVLAKPPRTPASMGISNSQYLMTGGCLFLALLLMTDVQAWLPQSEVKEICQEVIRPDAILSRDHLAKLLAVSERTAKTAIQQVVAEPYCRLPSVSIRAGVVAEREVYPLAFDPDTWLIMLYEGDEYAGFDFSFRK